MICKPLRLSRKDLRVIGAVIGYRPRCSPISLSVRMCTRAIPLIT